MDKPKTMEKQTTLKYVTRIDPITGIQSNPEDKRKVFISYKRDDGESIRNLITNKIIGLEDVAVWFDEKGLHSGEEYDKEIIGAISDCDALVLILTSKILESQYVWNIEVKKAIEQNKGIIPIAYNLPKNVYATAEQKLGKALHILTLPSASVSRQRNLNAFEKQEDRNFEQALENALRLYVIDVDLAQMVKSFFDAGKHNMSERYLNPEQLFLKGFGYLNGIGVDRDEAKGVTLFSKLAEMYRYNKDDAKMVELASDSATELVKYYTKKNDAGKVKHFIFIAEQSLKPDVLREIVWG